MSDKTRYVLFAPIAGASVIAHSLFNRHEFHLFADGMLWITWFYCLFYAFDNLYPIKTLIYRKPLVASAAFLVLHHLSMFISPMAENVVAALFLLFVVIMGFKSFYEILGDELR